MSEIYETCEIEIEDQIVNVDWPTKVPRNKTQRKTHLKAKDSVDDMRYTKVKEPPLTLRCIVNYATFERGTP